MLTFTAGWYLTLLLNRKYGSSTSNIIDQKMFQVGSAKKVSN